MGRKRKNRRITYQSLYFVFLFFIAVFIPSIVYAEAKSLISTGNGNWDTAGTWLVSGSDPATYQVPDSDDSVTINTGHTITLNTTGVCASISISNSGGLTFGNGNDLTVYGAVTSDGTITINSTSGISLFSISGTLAITDHGSLTMNPANTGAGASISCDNLTLTDTSCTMNPTNQATSSITLNATSAILTLTGSTFTMSPTGSGSTSILTTKLTSINSNSSCTVTPTTSASVTFNAGNITNNGTLRLETNTSASITSTLSLANSNTATFKTNTATDTIAITLDDAIYTTPGYITTSGSTASLSITGFSESARNVTINADYGYIYSTSDIVMRYVTVVNVGAYTSGDITKQGICISGVDGYNNSSAVQLQNLAITGGWSGIVLNGCDHLTSWFDCYISTNTITATYHAGIHLYNTKRSEIINNTCYNNDGSNTGYGIYLESSSMNTVNNNTAYGNKFFNFYFNASDKNFVEANTLYSADTQEGFYLLSSNYNVILNNTVRDNYVHGLALQASSNNILVKNRCYSNGKSTTFNSGSGIRFRYSSNSNVCLCNFSYGNKEAGLNSYQSINNLCMEEKYGHDGTAVQANNLGDILFEGDQDQGQISQVWFRNCLFSSPTEVADTTGKQEFTKDGSWMYSQKHNQENGTNRLYGKITLPVSGYPQGTESTLKYNYSDQSYAAFATTPYLRYDYNFSGYISPVTFSATTEPECWMVTYDTATNRWNVRGTTSGVQTNTVIPDGTTYNSDGTSPKVSFRVTQSLTPNEYGIQYVFVTGGAATDTNTQKKIQLTDFQDDLGQYIGAKLTADSGSTVEFEGTSSAPTLIDHKNRDGGSDFYYGFELKGTVNKLNYTTFKYLNENGLMLSAVPTSANSTGLRIENVKTGGAHLNFTSITHTFDNIYLDNSGVYNSSGTATVTFRDYYRYNLTDAAGVTATWDPTLSWSGQTDFTGDGVNPNDALTNSNFEFQVKYTDKGIAANGDVPSAIQVWVDSNDNGTFEDTEKHDMTKITQSGVNNGNYSDGETYTYTYPGMTFAGDGRINYRFYAINDNSTTMIGTTTSHEATGVGTTTVPQGETAGTPTNGYAYLSISGSAPRVNITTPTTEVSGEVTLTYTLIDSESNTCSVACEYSTDGGTTWSAATKGAGGDSITGLVSSPTGIEKTFVWATRTDLPNQKAQVKFKITPSDVIGSGTAGITDTFDVTNTASGSKSTVTCSQATIPADGTTKTTVTVALKDPDGNAVTEKNVTISATGSDNSITQPTAATDGNGETIGYLASTKAEQKVITATISDDSIEIQQKPTVTFTPLAVDPDRSTITYSPSEIVADGSTKATITVTLMDKFNNPVSDKQLSLSVTGSSNFLTQPAALTNASGQTTGALASNKMETKTVSARDVTDSITLNSKATIVFVPVSGLAVDNTTLVPGDPAKQNISIFYANPDRVETTLQIFNLTGALIFEKQIPANNVALWDGKNADGQMVETGIYIYQLDIGGTIKNGAIAIVK